MGISCLGSENTELAITDDASDDSQDNRNRRRSPDRWCEARILMLPLVVPRAICNINSQKNKCSHVCLSVFSFLLSSSIHNNTYTHKKIEMNSISISAEGYVVDVYDDDDVAL